MKANFFHLIWIVIFCCQAKVGPVSGAEEASVVNVEMSGDPENYQFSVTLSSPDLGCQQYADWWEVVDTSGKLRYRRILTHSHVNEQPFTRSGGSVDLLADEEVWVRVHMNNTGYSKNAMFGSFESGFEARDFPNGIAEGLDQQAPLPNGCRF